MRHLRFGYGSFVCLLAVWFVMASTPVRVQAQATPTDLTWVPADAPLFLSLRVADVWKQESVNDLRTRVATTKVDLAQEIEKNLGLLPTEVERLLVIVPAPGQNPVFVLTTVRPAREKLLAAQMPGATEKQRRGKSYHVSAEGDRALYAAGENLLLLGPSKLVLQLVEQQSARKPDSPLHDGVRAMTGKEILTAWLNLTAIGEQVKNGLPPQAAAVLPLLEAKPGIVTLTSEAATRLTVSLTCPDDEEAKKKALVLRTTVDILRQFIPIGQVEIGKQKPRDDTEKWLFGQAERFLKELLDGCKTVQIETRGRVVHGQMQVKVNAGALLTIAAGVFLVREAGPPAP